ncbi:Positive regulator of purine utilization 4 [Colletotrichum chlorophyti]|uniref:Positive regulator of purine utilization 4 n=1 Tax=Colletotrichum chlorophyti TaxID=708187 RepID=A0A1Q8RXL9_9PEZI|nr:Positive regulator of purine utilization 4 [Colletotrichum chlorophyti]
MFDETAFNLAASTSAPHPESPVSPATALPAESPQARKPRVALACKRCKRRKQRCDGAHPSCSSCEKVNSACVYERTLRPQYPGGKSLYISALEERIAFLEARMPDYAEDHFAASSMASPRDSEPQHPRRSSRGSHSEDEQSSLVDGVAYLSLCASGATDTTPEPFYLGSSSGATIARMIQSSIFHGAGIDATHGILPAAQHEDSPCPRPPPSTSPRSDEASADFPSPSQAKMLFDVFFDRLHTRWPILDRKLYTALFERQYNYGALSIQQRSIMHLRHLMAAIEPMDYILEQHNLATVQLLLLLAVHGTRSPYGAGAWSQVRYAVTLCIELGLHRKQTATPSHSPRDLEIRRRVFWSCYCLDRMTSVVLGRPFAIADRDIKVELPSVSFELWDLTATGEPPSASNLTCPWSNMKPFIHIIKLRRIQSKIQRRVYRVDKDIFAGPPADRSRLDSKMIAIREELDDWARTIPHPPKAANSIAWMYDPENAFHDSTDFFDLQYHKSILSLLTVLLPTLDTSDGRFLATARSAACVCTAYKRLNQQKTLSYTMMALHSCFIAGLTLVYCLWRDRALFSYDALEATRACSQSLTIFGEKWPGAVKYRDIFDALSGSLFKAIVHPAPASGPVPTPLIIDFGMAPQGSPIIQDTRDSGTGTQRDRAEKKSAMGHAISEAVKEAFMEVDEEAPGGWQGWRIFNEMVQGDLKTSADGQVQALGGQLQNNEQQGHETLSWSSQQSATTGVLESDWDLGGLQ